MCSWSPFAAIKASTLMRRLSMLEHSAFQFNPKVVRSGLCAGQSSSSTPISKKHFCMYLALCTGALSCWNKKEPSPTYCHKVGSTESFMSLYAVALRFPFTGIKEPKPWQTVPDHYSSSTKLYLALCIRAGSVLLASAKPRFVSRTAGWGSMIHHSKEGISTAP